MRTVGYVVVFIAPAMTDELKNEEEHVAEKLREQLNTTKTVTWREKTDEAMGYPNLVELPTSKPTIVELTDDN